MADEVFRHDGYMSEFEAGITAVDGDKVIMDCTCFYPGGGGQVCDTGTINGFRVTDVHYDSKGEIVHVVPGHNLSVGLRVWCSVDWERRFDLMMGHTAEHLLFCSLHREDPELAITKIFIGPEEKYVIVNHDVAWETIGKALEFANEQISKNLSVRKTTMSRDDPELSKVRIKLDRIPGNEEITVVSIGDIDHSACSGVHVMETGELETLFVDRKVSAGKDGTAIHFKVGRAARDSAIRLANICLQAIDEADSKPQDIVRTISNLKEELAAATEARKTSTKQALNTMAPRNVHGTSLYAGMFADADKKTLSEAAEKFRSGGAAVVFVSAGENVSVLIASGTPKVDCRRIVSEILPKFGGRGGGKSESAQGGAPDAKKARELFDALVKAVERVL